MTSPFAAQANAELIFQIADGAIESDRYGNPVPISSSYKVIALLKPSSANAQERAGVDETEELMEGYLVDPLNLPDGINPLMVAEATITVALNKRQTGTFKLLPTTQNPFLIAAGIDNLTKVQGIFRRL